MWDFKEVSAKENTHSVIYFIFVFCAQIRMTCIENLFELNKSRTAIDKILLAKKYKVKKWLRHGYVQLLKSKELELGDGVCTSEIDMTTLARLLYYIRERKHCELKPTKCIALIATMASLPTPTVNRILQHRCSQQKD